MGQAMCRYSAIARSGNPRGKHLRLRRRPALAYMQRWADVVSTGLMRAVASAAMHGEGSDLANALLGAAPGAADLVVK